MSPKDIREGQAYYRVSTAGRPIRRTVIRIKDRGQRWGRLASTAMYEDEQGTLCTQKLAGFARWAQGEAIG